MIRDDIKSATIAAMKGGDKETTQTLRLVQAAIKNRDIEARTGGAPKDDDALVTASRTRHPSACASPASTSSSFEPTLPMCGNVNATTCLA